MSKFSNLFHDSIFGPGGTPRAKALSPGKPKADDAAQRRGAPLPAELALSRLAAAWLDGLPPHVRPAHLCAEYPRLANRFALCWSDEVLAGRLFDDLLLDSRGNRRGFSPAIAVELMRLREFHARYLARKEPPDTSWDLSSFAVQDR